MLYILQYLYFVWPILLIWHAEMQMNVLKSKNNILAS